MPGVPGRVMQIIIVSTSPATTNNATRNTVTVSTVNTDLNIGCELQSHLCPACSALVVFTVTFVVAVVAAEVATVAAVVELITTVADEVVSPLDTVVIAVDRVGAPVAILVVGGGAVLVIDAVDAARVVTVEVAG